MLLAGCGVYDGSEIHESVSVLIHLSRSKIPYDCYSLDKLQHDVIHTGTGTPMQEQ